MFFLSGYAILLVILIAIGFVIGLLKLSFWWGLLPVLIGGFVGSYLSPLAKQIIDPRVDQATKEKLLPTVRILLVGWIILSAIFIAMGYSLTFLVTNPQ